PSTKYSRGYFWGQVAMESEVTRFPVLPLLPAIENRMRLVFGREYQCYVEARIHICRREQLLCAEIFDLDDRHRLLHIAKIWMCQFAASGPGGEHVGMGISSLQPMQGVPVQAYVVAVGEIVFRGKPVGRIHKQPGDK